jgi:membrane protein DedA with SNARE-associated domain
MLHAFFQWLIDTISSLGYAGLVVLMAIESSVLPLPSELVMPPAGYLAAKGQMDPILAVIAGTTGSILGALLNYGLATWLGEPLLRRFGRYVLISGSALDRSESFFKRHGEIGTLLGRLVPVVRHLISIPAGLARMNLPRFALFTGLGAGLWCGILVYIGWLVGHNAEAIGSAAQAAYAAQAHHWVVYRVLPGVVVLLVGYIAWYRSRTRADRMS